MDSAIVNGIQLPALSSRSFIFRFLFRCAERQAGRPTVGEDCRRRAVALSGYRQHEP